MKIKNDFKSNHIYGDKKAIHNLKSCSEGCIIETRQLEIISNMHDKENWFNKNINTSILTEIMYFPTLDLRRFKEYNKQTDAQYLTRGLEALKKQELKKNAPKKENNNKSKKQLKKKKRRGK